MSKIRILLVLLGIAALPAAAQQLVRVDPDCPVNGAAFAFTSAGQFYQIDNRQSGCSNWTVTYNQVGPGALQIELQSAPDNGAGPGTWVTFATATIITGANPSTATPSGIISLQGYQPWVRVIIDSQTTTILGYVFGSRSAAASTPPPPSTPCPGTTAVPCVVIGPDAPGAAPTQNPVQVGLFDGTDVRRARSDSTGRAEPAFFAGSISDGLTNNATIAASNGGTPLDALSYNILFNGTTWDRSLKCPSSVIVDDSTMGNVQIIALSGVTSIRICKMSWTASSAVGIQLTQGTGANCGTGTTNLSFLYGAGSGVSAIAEDFQADQALLVAASGNAVCLNLSAATRTTGQVWYAQF